MYRNLFQKDKIKEKAYGNECLNENISSPSEYQILESEEEKELEESSLSGVEPDIEINSSSLEYFCEELIVENLVFGAEPYISTNSPRNKTCEELLVIKKT